MAVRNKTIFEPNRIYFITFTILDWKNIFINDRYCQLVYKWFDYMKLEYGNKIHGYVIMPNHIHAILFISDRSKKLPILIFNAKRFLSYEITQFLQEDNQSQLLEFFRDNAAKSARHKIFEPRYDSLFIDSEKFFLEKINYVHNNPCQEKWNLAEKPEDYKYSSAANYLDGKGCYDVDVI